MKVRVPGFSIVVCTYNGKDRLQETLKHILRLKIPNNTKLELIVVDNRSTDGTEEFVKQFFQEHRPNLELSLLREEKPGKPYALEKAFDRVSYSHAITCDDDNWLDTDYLIYANQIIQEKPRIGIIGARLVGVFEGTIPAWFDMVKGAFVVGEQAKSVGYFDQDSDFVWGAGMILKMEVWDKLRSVDFSFVIGKNIGKAVGEDSELSLLTKYLGYRFYYDDRLLLKHFMPEKRLSLEVAKGYYRGFGSTKPYFIIYKNIYRKGGQLSFLEIEREIIRLMIFISKKYWSYKKKRKNSEGILFSLEYELFKSYFIEVFSLLKFRRNVYTINYFMGRFFKLNNPN